MHFHKHCTCIVSGFYVYQHVSDTQFCHPKQNCSFHTNTWICFYFLGLIGGNAWNAYCMTSCRWTLLEGTIHTWKDYFHEHLWCHTCLLRCLVSIFGLLGWFMMKSVEELSSIGTSFSGSLVCVSEIVTFGWDCVRVRTDKVGDAVTGMLGVLITLVGFFCLDWLPFCNDRKGI